MIIFCDTASMWIMEILAIPTKVACCYFKGLKHAGCTYSLPSNSWKEIKNDNWF